MINKLRVQGKVSQKGKLRLYGQMEFDKFLEDNKNKRVIIEVITAGTEPSPNMKAFYKKVVLPTFQDKLKEAGEYVTLDKLDETLRNSCIATKKQIFQKNIEWREETMELENLNKEEWILYFQELNQLAAEYGFKIDEPL